MKKLLGVLSCLGLSVAGAFAEATVDLTATGAAVKTDMLAAMVVGLTLFAVLFGIRMVLKTAKASSKG